MRAGEAASVDNTPQVFRSVLRQSAACWSCCAVLAAAVPCMDAVVRCCTLLSNNGAPSRIIASAVQLTAADSADVVAGQQLPGADGCDTA